MALRPTALPDIFHLELNSRSEDQGFFIDLETTGIDHRISVLQIIHTQTQLGAHEFISRITCESPSQNACLPWLLGDDLVRVRA